MRKVRKRGNGCLLSLVSTPFGETPTEEGRSFSDNLDLDFEDRLVQVLGKRKAKKLLSGKVEGLKFGDLYRAREILTALRLSPIVSAESSCKKEDL